MVKMFVAAAAAFLFAVAGISAQDLDFAEKGELVRKYSDRYNLLVSKLGQAGVGIETVLDGWAAVDSTDVDLLKARFSYYFAKSQTSEVVIKNQKKFLGKNPIITLKDSTGNNVFYFEETFYDDALYGKSVKYLDKAIKLYPERLDLRFMKAASLLAYEKESPDMALGLMLKLVDENYLEGKKWVYPDVVADSEFFESAIQQYCYSFYNIGTQDSYSAFKTLSEKMLDYQPKNTLFISNIGSYYLVAESNPKTALKYYNKVLKIKPDDYTAIKNCIIIARKQRDIKLEKKYLPLIIKYGTEADKITAEARLNGLK